MEMSRQLCIQSMDAPSTFPHTCPVHLFHALVLELYPLTINQKMFSCEPLQQINWTLGGCGGKLWSRAGRWEAQVSTWTCNCCLRWGRLRLSCYLWDLTLPAGREGQNCLKLLLSSWVWGDRHTAPQHTHIHTHSDQKHQKWSFLWVGCEE